MQHDFDGSAQLTTTLVHAISDVTGTAVTNTEFTLNDYVDPDALNRLFGSTPDGTARATGELHLTIWGCDVTIFASGQIVIVPPLEHTHYQQ